MRICFSYGHDKSAELAKRIRADLEGRKHKVWIDESEIKAGDDWRRAITGGILGTDVVLAFLSKHSVRTPGVCLDEIAIAIGEKYGNIKTILVESETEVSAPPSVSHIQWLDMQNWTEKRAAGKAVWDAWYKDKLAEIIRVVEGDESVQFTGEIETLRNLLKPMPANMRPSDSRIASLLGKGFVGRQWLDNEVKQWAGKKDNDSRLFWIVGEPGIGKSAFAANLTHFGRDRIIAAQFCEWDKPYTMNGTDVVRGIAFQLAARLPDYRKLLLKRLIVEMLAVDVRRLPKWLALMVTSRPESSVTSPLQWLKPYILHADSEENRDDIRCFIYRRLESHLYNRPNADNLIEQILNKSEGLFLYVEHVCNDINRDYLSLDRIDEFPQGLGGIYRKFFERQFPKQKRFETDVLPVLRAVLAAREPLPIAILKAMSGLKDEPLRKLTRTLGSLFPTATGEGGETIRPFHKSIPDRLNDYDKAGIYYVSLTEGHAMLAEFGYKQYEKGLDKLHKYFIRNLPAHLIEAKEWDRLETVLTDILFIQEKCKAGQTYDIVNDYNKARKQLPKGKKELVETFAREFIRQAHHIYHRPNLAFQQLYNELQWQKGRVKTTAAKARQKFIEKGGRFLHQYRTPKTITSYNIMTLSGHSDTVTSCTYSQDGSRIVSASEDKTLKIWDANSGKEIAAYRCEDEASACAICGDKIVCGDGSGNVYFLKMVGFDD
ncbi:MAG: TIR domain-containing protein [Nitrospirae bacterium]|nr:TIR domain-containing protein [Nitrospirota bacterium]